MTLSNQKVAESVHVANERNERSLIEMCECVQLVLDDISNLNFDASAYAQRAEDDIRRIMNSVLLTCHEIKTQDERKQERLGDALEPSATAVEFALNAVKGEEGLAFLRLWQQGKFQAIRAQWPDAPEAIYLSSGLRSKAP